MGGIGASVWLSPLRAVRKMTLWADLAILANRMKLQIPCKVGCAGALPDFRSRLTAIGEYPHPLNGKPVLVLEARPDSKLSGFLRVTRMDGRQETIPSGELVLY